MHTSGLTLYAGPSIAGTAKQGWWGADEYVWVFYDTRTFTDSRVPAAEGFDGSSGMHALYSRCEAPETTKIDGPLNARGVFCPCDPCESFDFSPRACEMASEYGTFRLEYAKRLMRRDPRTTRSQELEAFALSLR